MLREAVTEMTAEDKPFKDPNLIKMKVGTKCKALFGIEMWGREGATN